MDSPVFPDDGEIIEVSSNFNDRYSITCVMPKRFLSFIKKEYLSIEQEVDRYI